MARPQSFVTELEPVVAGFVDRIVAAFDAHARDRLRADLMRSMGGGSPSRSPRGAQGPSRPASRSSTVRTRRSAELVTARRLQGRYLGTLRKLGGAARAKVKAAARKSGVRAGIAMAENLLRRGRPKRRR